MTERLRVDQFVPCLLPRDAVGNHTLGVRSALERRGVENHIWAISVHPDLDAYGRPFGAFKKGPRGRPEVALYEAASVAGDFADFVVQLPQPKALYYHNLTPPEYFDEFDPEIARGLRQARTEVERIAAVSRLGIAASEFNAAELRQLGMADVVVIPPYPAPDAAVAPDPDQLAALRETKTGIDLLFVGRLAPNKRQERLIRLVAALRSAVDPGARLFLVGGPGPTSYVRGLQRLADTLAPDAVTFTGPVSDAVLAAHYAAADLFVSTSEHEGFGLPLLEAMRAGVPIIAYDAGAVAETLGGAGVVVRSTDPRILAEVVAKVARDPELKAALRARQAERAQELHTYPRDERLVEALARAAR